MGLLIVATPTNRIYVRLPDIGQMRNFGEMDAAKLSIEWNMDHSDDFAMGKIDLPNPGNSWHPAIVREAYRLSKIAQLTVAHATEIQENHIKTEINTIGRLVEPAHPVQLSKGVLDSIELTEEVEPILDDVKHRVKFYEEKASFDTNCVYNEGAKAGMNFSRTIIPRTKLYLHTYLWILWTYEALRQANQFGGQLQEGRTLKGFSVNAFPYIAHPPLIVATLACTTMIEEVGTKYLNSYVDGVTHHRTNTSAGAVLVDIKTHYPDSGKFNFQIIGDYVIKARNDISHYVTKRKNVVGIEEFEPFCNAVIEGTRLVEVILDDLIRLPISSFHDKLEQMPI